MGAGALAEPRCSPHHLQFCMTMTVSAGALTAAPWPPRTAHLCSLGTQPGTLLPPTYPGPPSPRPRPRRTRSPPVHPPGSEPTSACSSRCPWPPDSTVRGGGLVPAAGPWDPRCGVAALFALEQPFRVESNPGRPGGEVLLRCGDEDTGGESRHRIHKSRQKPTGNGNLGPAVLSQLLRETPEASSPGAALSWA
ncbi:unnamed protein product [Rangifer tarandus platyrhynchus]|uniref:Uncharacterized protein n=1 Tax=Rangifer tarandus platyrhynchus TaxID=3082113 RepID=A0AC59YG89_RANTA